MALVRHSDWGDAAEMCLLLLLGQPCLPLGVFLGRTPARWARQRGLLDAAATIDKEVRHRAGALGGGCCTLGEFVALHCSLIPRAPPPPPPLHPTGTDTGPPTLQTTLRVLFRSRAGPGGLACDRPGWRPLLGAGCPGLWSVTSPQTSVHPSTTKERGCAPFSESAVCLAFKHNGIPAIFATLQRSGGARVEGRTHITAFPWPRTARTSRPGVAAASVSSYQQDLMHHDEGVFLALAGNEAEAVAGEGQGCPPGHVTATTPPPQGLQ